MEIILRKIDFLCSEGGMILETTLKVGDIAPEFSLPATTKEKISLSDYRGSKNVVVAFYGMDFTPG
jgi:peroxiredoxin